MSKEKKKSLSWSDRFTLLGLVLVPLLIITGVIWGVYSVIKTPEYKDLHKKQGYLVYKKEAGGGKVNRHYYLKVNIDGEEYAFSMRIQFRSVYRKLQPGDLLEISTKSKNNIKSRQQNIWELKVNGELLVPYDRVVKPNSQDRFSQWLSLILLGIIIVFVLANLLSGKSKEKWKPWQGKFS